MKHKEIIITLLTLIVILNLIPILVSHILNSYWGE